MNDENNFCVSCGAKLPEGATFCPECGMSLNGDAPSRGPSDMRTAGPVKGGSAVIPIFILLYGIFGLIVGVIALVEAVAIDQAMYQALIDSLNQAFIDSGMDPVQILPEWSDTTKLLMIVAAVFGTLSPLAAIGSYYYCYKTGPRKTAVQLCLASTVLILGLCVFIDYAYCAIPCFIIGAIMTYVLKNSSDVFTS